MDKVVSTVHWKLMKKVVFPHSTRAQESTVPGSAERLEISSGIMTMCVSQTANTNMAKC